MASHLENQKILIVEDDSSIREVMFTALSEAGYSVELAEQAEEAEQKIKSFQPHMVLMDHDMPGLTGLELLKQLRKESNYVTVIFVSGRTDTSLVVDVLRSGADDYIKKPFRINELLARVEASFRTHKLHIQLLEANQKLQNMVDHDFLTGLYNMRSMYDKIGFELKRAKRFKRGIACVMIDMDHFKRVNDENDHLFGSFVLKKMGSLISHEIREIDFAARYGGDEFLVVLTEVERKGVEIFCERLRKRIEDYTFKDKDDQIDLTISLGYALATESHEMDAKELVRRADQQLYKAKEGGRNCVVGTEI